MKTPTNTNNHIGISVLLLTCTILLISCGGCRSSKVESVSIHTDKDIDSNQIASSDTGKDTTSHFDLGILKDAPMLPLEEVDITEVYDHYILQDSANYQKYHFYDGKRQQTVDFSGPDVHIQVSRNQKYLTKMTLIQNKMSNQYFLDVELRDCSNHLIAKQSIPSAYQDYYDELRDEVIPLDNGSGILQIGRRLGQSCWFKVYKYENQKLVSKIFYSSDTLTLQNIQFKSDNENLILLSKSETNLGYLSMYNINKGQIWTKDLPYGVHLGNFDPWSANNYYVRSEEYIFLFYHTEHDNFVHKIDYQGNTLNSYSYHGIVYEVDTIRKSSEFILCVYTNQGITLINSKTNSIIEINLYETLRLKNQTKFFIKGANLINENYIFSFVLKNYSFPKEHCNGFFILDQNYKYKDVFKSKISGNLIKNNQNIFIISSYTNNKQFWKLSRN